jgi:hypothetical protein
MQSLTGFWVLNTAKSSSQKPLLVALGKADWQIKIIDDADENFLLGHCVDKKGVHVLHKEVLIFLRASILRLVSWIYPVNRIEYQHSIRADGKPVFHPDDQKQLGDCDTVASWDQKTQSFVIRWYLKKPAGLLISSHTIDEEGSLKVTLTFTNPSRETCKVYKCYDRHELSAQQIQKLRDLDPLLTLTF